MMDKIRNLPPVPMALGSALLACLCVLNAIYQDHQGDTVKTIVFVMAAACWSGCAAIQVGQIKQGPE